MAVSASKTPLSTVIELHIDNADGRVRIVPMDRDIMAMPVVMAIEACRAFNEQVRFRDQFDLLLEHLAEWVQPREQNVSAAYVTIRDAGLLFLVATKGKTYDADLESALTELDLEIANDKDFSLINMSVHAIPCCDAIDLKSFLSEKLAMRYMLHEQRNSAH